MRISSPPPNFRDYVLTYVIYIVFFRFPYLEYFLPCINHVLKNLRFFKWDNLDFRGPSELNRGIQSYDF